ncbi:MAG: hypothetical protein PHR44_07505 [Candidatus Omnitrophica bacterium]|nr:hypothetical protein [Candidatus Omnitrophota bacterium]
MALKPQNKKHEAQILAGTIGRKKGHNFEKDLTCALNLIDVRQIFPYPNIPHHIVMGKPSLLLLYYVAQKKELKNIKKIKAWWLGGLATSGEGDKLTDKDGQPIAKSKSDVLIEIQHGDKVDIAGISVKTCDKETPTNDQLYFTTASAFCGLLRANNIPISKDAEIALKMFCGDAGFRPTDSLATIKERKSDPDRWFWEELPKKLRLELEAAFIKYQKEISTVLLQKAYPNDPYPPEFLLHQTKKYSNINNCEVALFTIDELIDLSCKACRFTLKPYFVRKGRFKGDPSKHLAPRFGFIQMQRGGQKQHPTQLQFNLQAGYFYKIGENA